jgi:hypothetical protein
MSLFSKRESDQARHSTMTAVELEARSQAASRAYGINEVIGLMRSLPMQENVELVVRVIRSTLESLNVHLPGIIEDATAREKSLETRMETVNAEIVELTKQIETRRQENTRLDAELTETATAKERLLLAQKLPAIPQAALAALLATPAVPPGPAAPAPPSTGSATASRGTGAIPPPPPLKLPVSVTPALHVEID